MSFYNRSTPLKITNYNKKLLRRRHFMIIFKLIDSLNNNITHRQQSDGVLLIVK